jgi:hypothetical protein
MAEADTLLCHPERSKGSQEILRSAQNDKGAYSPAHCLPSPYKGEGPG